MLDNFFSGLGGFVLGAVPSAALILRILHRHRQEREASGVSHLSAVADRQERHIALLTKQVQELQARVDQAIEHEKYCEVALAEVYGYLVQQHYVNTRLAASARNRGEDPGPVPSLPKRPTLQHDEDEARERSSRQNSKLLEGITGQLQDELDDGGKT